ncbi:hypothetical protein GCM10022254_09790 [Actinomadura meridiana]|uniref:DUF488 domain-containing protein n=1 Tax=Actinomadura meridiana TaxID=559626 RepID=A0ABP8BTS6_9ACTN
MILPLATCSYAEFTPSMGVPVRSTVGAPRYRLPYKLAGHAKLITPTRPMLNLERAPYRHAYTELLDGHGADNIAAELTEIARTADATPGDRLVLLCFDVLSKPDVWCHRRMFAVWWLAQHAQEVPELGKTTPRLLF